MNYNYLKSKEETMLDLAVEIRNLIPEKVRGMSTDTMVNCPNEVFYFAKLYIEDLQREIELLRNK